jgi:plasmid stability protein
MQSMIIMKSIPQDFSGAMASITIRNLDESVKARLRIAAARHGCSMEEEVRQILRRTLITEDGSKSLGTKIHQRFGKLGGIDLTIPGRSTPRPPPDLSDPNQ